MKASYETSIGELTEMTDTLATLANAIAAGSTTTSETMGKAMSALFGSRFHKRSAPGVDHDRPPFLRNAYSRTGRETDHVAYAGFINPENPPSGPYGGASLVWFPQEEGSLIAFVVGTRGLSPDEGILTRPGHRRRIASLRHQLVQLGIRDAWARQDPAALGDPVPELVASRLGAWMPVFKRYGNELYCTAPVPRNDPALSRHVVQAFVDLYAYERRWEVLKAAESEVGETIHRLGAQWLASPTQTEVEHLLAQRRFVVLEGPPGTGKTRLALKILSDAYGNRGRVTQFHPSTTYEDFVAGLAPDVASNSLQFQARPGHLMQAAKAAQSAAALLVIDEVNRADLGRVLGEAIYLFEVDAGGDARTVSLPHAIEGSQSFCLPANLHVLATMNTADRSVARMDLAIRRRFAFVSVMPDRKVVEAHSTEAGLHLFDALTTVFIEYAPDDAMNLLPGHSYFIAVDDNTLRVRLQHELIPLVDEYLREGYLGPATSALHAVRNQLADFVTTGPVPES
ncbi:MAG: AAA family ATPase [Burkholderiaceae bacterium]